MPHKNTQSPITHSNSPSLPNPNPFLYVDYVKTQLALQQALSGPQFYALVTGPSGVGKTSLVRDMVRNTDPKRHHIIYVSSAKSTLFSMVRLLALNFHVNPHQSHLETLRALAETIQAHTTRVLIWIDEVDQLNMEVLQQIRMLAESTPSPEPLMSMVLSGLGSFHEHLNKPQLFPLKRRISLHLSLSGLRRDELEPFLVHRFGSQDAMRIPKNLCDELFERTQANPALINQIVRLALLQSNSSDAPIDPEAMHVFFNSYTHE
jgi:type II secretory pathway predicted ATPase ExeA